VAMQWSWRTLTGAPIGDVVDFVRDNAREGQAVYVGTDSLQLARHTRFVTVVAILTPRRRGRAIYRREVRPRIVSLRERLLREVWLSVELGLRLSPVVPGPLSVHIDANPVETHRSSRYVQELVGLPPATRPMAPGPAARAPHSVIGVARSVHGF
jgi:predicted RNase H-related nuclease YkuK (DUF458 family)